MTGPIYFGGLHVEGDIEANFFATDSNELQNSVLEHWKQESKNVLKFIEDSKLDMPLIKNFLSSATANVKIQEYRETKSA